MLFYNVLILFWGVLEHALMLGGLKNTFFHIIYIIIIPLSTASHKRLDQFRVWWRPAFQKQNELWFVSCDRLAFPVRCDWWTA